MGVSLAVLLVSIVNLQLNVLVFNIYMVVDAKATNRHSGMPCCAGQ